MNIKKPTKFLIWEKWTDCKLYYSSVFFILKSTFNIVMESFDYEPDKYNVAL